MPSIIIYTKDCCPFCRYAKALLRSKDVDFREIDVTHHEHLQDEMRRLSGRWTVPQVFIDGKPVGGFDELRQLEAAGELDRLLGTYT